MNTTRELCAVLNGVGGGLQREVMVNINVTEYTATGMYTHKTWFVAEKCIMYLCVNSQQLTTLLS